MNSKTEIKSAKIVIKDIFSQLWFRVPEYQRPYVWGYDEVIDLLEDLSFASKEKSESEYFLGSLVFQSKKARPNEGQEYDENDLLDGQQRMTTLLLLFGVIRDLSKDSDAKDECQKCIHLKANKFTGVPERTRLVYAIRPEVQKFIDEYIKTRDGTGREKDLEKIADRDDDLSRRNMAKAILNIRKYFLDNPEVMPDDLLEFLLKNVLLIYVSTENLDDAFRLFTILNDRGIPLRNSDILKSLNLGALEKDSEKETYAKMWEAAEGELGDDFDRFLGHVRTILVKEKARLNLLQEYEDKIYNPKEKEKSTQKKKPALLKRGKETFEMVERYLGHYMTLKGGLNYDEFGNFRFDNLIKVMDTTLPSTDWQPPLLRYFDKFRYDQLFEFLVKLDNKFSADWISQLSPTDRIEEMNRIIRFIDIADSPADVFNTGGFDFKDFVFDRELQGEIYGRRFARYILLKLDYLYQNHDQKMNFETLSVEHILPQNPSSDSQWIKDFTMMQRDEMTDRLGNLVLITRTKNASQGRLDYIEKKKNYFKKCIDTCPNSLRVLNTYAQWTPAEYAENHAVVLKKLREHYSQATQSGTGKVRK
jgi:uncharacterized protein with ParB-like and HNH nuclease domain